MNKPIPSWAHLRNVIANVQVSLSLAAYTKVNIKWRQMDFVPDFCRFYYIVDGEGCLEIDGISYYPKPGQLFVMPSGVKQSYYATDEHNTFGKHWCHFTAKIGDRDLFQLLGLPVLITPDDPERLIELFKELTMHYESEGFTAIIRQKSVLLEIIAMYLEKAMATHSASRIVNEQHRMHQLHTVLNYIEQHLDEPITVPELAELVHFHPNYFIRHFHELVGMSPIQYINHMKMEKAMQVLLAEDGLPVSEAARSVGMELYYFSRLFKKHAGLSPTGYRELFRKP